MRREVIFKPGFDRRNPEPSNDYGIHGMEIRFILKNYKGAVVFLLYTNWFPTSTGDLKWFELVLPKLDDKEPIKPMFVQLLINPFLPKMLLKPFPADLGYHSLRPKYEGQKSITKECQYLDGKPCYYDGSGLNAIRVFNTLLNEGDEGLWRELKNYHESIFGESILKGLRKKINRTIDVMIKIYSSPSYRRELIIENEKKIRIRKDKN